MMYSHMWLKSLSVCLDLAIARPILLCGLLSLGIASCGIMWIENSYHHVLLLKDKEENLKSIITSDTTIISPCETIGKKDSLSDTLNKLEINATNNGLVVHHIAQKTAPNKTIEWVVSGQYHHIMAWLTFISNQALTIALENFQMWKEAASQPTLFFSTEMIIYEDPACHKNN